jgi:hypothetical protein
MEYLLIGERHFIMMHGSDCWYDVFFSIRYLMGVH